ncbi:hypothetical protein ACMGGS_12095 [Superficieibacter sp. BNK-5]|uniref:hypothetical protein n=1 Tax=Superficieibacter sp. BNK-5 TaxID=3376142 RepID=UPI0039BF740B
MIDNSFIVDELGFSELYSIELLEISMKFTMAYYYCEDVFFNRYCRIAYAENYSQKILDLIGDSSSKEILKAFTYFKQRYLLGGNAQDRIYALTMESNGDSHNLSDKMTNYFSDEGGDVEKMLSVNLMVIIRLRNNLLHANKYEAMNNNPNDQTELLSVAYSLLASLLYSSNRCKSSIT